MKTKSLLLAATAALTAGLARANKPLHPDPLRAEAWAQAQDTRYGKARVIHRGTDLAVVAHRRDPDKDWPLNHAGSERAFIRLSAFSIQRTSGLLDYRPGDVNIVPAGDFMGGGHTLAKEAAYVLEVQCPPAKNRPISEAEKAVARQGKTVRNSSPRINLLDKAAALKGPAADVVAGACLRVSVRKLSSAAVLKPQRAGKTTVFVVLSGKGRVESGGHGVDIALGSVFFAQAGRLNLTVRPAGGPLVFAEVSAK